MSAGYHEQIKLMFSRIFKRFCTKSSIKKSQILLIHKKSSFFDKKTISTKKIFFLKSSLNCCLTVLGLDLSNAHLCSII